MCGVSARRSAEAGFLRPAIEVHFRLDAAAAVERLDLAQEQLAVAADLQDVVVGEAAPLLLDAASKLLPLSFQDVGAHPYLRTTM